MSTRKNPNSSERLEGRRLVKIALLLAVAIAIAISIVILSGALGWFLKSDKINLNSLSLSHWSWAEWGPHVSTNGDQSPEKAPKGQIRVLSYSSFLNSWGPGPEIAKRFRSETGIEVEFQDGGDAGLLLRKLEILPADVVIGLDGLALAAARRARSWRSIGASAVAAPAEAPAAAVDTLPTASPTSAELKKTPWDHNDFLAMDYGVLTFVYKTGEIEPPQSLDDLLHSRFRGAIALQDPRTSSPGLQFLLWVLDEKGIEAGFNFLKSLKPNIHSISGSWSSAYGLFAKGAAKLVFSYSTSPVYHWSQENNFAFASAAFLSGHPLQVEYVGVPESCLNCESAERFARFLRQPEIQKIIMEKNFMLPVVSSVREGTLFARLPESQERKSDSLDRLFQRKDELFQRWLALEL